MFQLRGIALLFVLCVNSLAAAEWRVEVSFSPEVRSEKFTGRVYLFTSPEDSEPRLALNWFRPEPFFARDVVDLEPGAAVTFSSADRAGLLAFSRGAERVELAGRNLQAVMRFNPWQREVGSGSGNGFSLAQRAPEATDSDEPLRLSVTRIVPERPFRETDAVKLCAVESPRLSAHYGRPVSVSAAVLLPPSYADRPGRRYPVMFIVPGFGGTHFEHATYARMYPGIDGETEWLRVLLDPSCPEGHHVFADSANNGPWGAALVEEFLPEFERRFRAVADREARFVTGHSSGGWSSLWLMATYPKTFAGTWSTAPDSVTFSDFSGIDLYAPGVNVYRDAEGRTRPLAHSGDQILFTYQSFDAMEHVLGHGGQLRSFEAVFGARGTNGPEPAWSRETGAVYADAVEHWRCYDIRLRLADAWPKRRELYAGRIHVLMGEEDTFYLAGASRQLKETLTELGEPDAVEMFPGKNHFNLLSAELMRRIVGEMGAHYRARFGTEGTALP